MSARLRFSSFCFLSMTTLRTLVMMSMLALTAVLLLACKQYQDEEHEKNLLIGMLMHEKFSKLEQALFELDEAYQQKHITQKQWHGRWYALANVGSGGIHARMKKWVEQTDSGEAYLLRAMYQQVRMWQMLEEERENEPKQSAELKRLAELVEADLTIAEQKIPKCALCLVERITVNRAQYRPVAESEKLLQQALALNPNFFAAINTYFVNLYPHWGGSYQKMRDFIAEMQKRGIDKEVIAGLESRYCWLQARTASENKDEDDALEWLKRGVNENPYDTLMKELALNYSERKDFANAVLILEKNLELNNPWDMRTIEALARAYNDAGQKEQADVMMRKRREVVQRYVVYE